MKLMSLVAALGLLTTIAQAAPAFAEVSTSDALSQYPSGLKLLEAAKSVGLSAALEGADNLIVLLPSSEALAQLKGLSKDAVKDVLDSHVFVNAKGTLKANDDYTSINGRIKINVNPMDVILYRIDRQAIDRYGDNSCGGRIGYFNSNSGLPKYSRYSDRGEIFFIQDKVLTVSTCY